MSCRRSAAPALVGALLLFGLAAAVPAGAVVPTVPETPPAHVVDLAGVVEPGAEARLDALLAALEARTGVQALVLTVTSLEGRPIEDFSLDLAHNRWRLGQKGADNGFLLTVAVGDRRYRFEVGYGLEGLLPDAAVGSIGRQILVPALRRGDFGGGIEGTMRAVAAQVAANAGVELPSLEGGAPIPGAGPGRRPPSPLELLVAFLVAVALLVLFVKNPQLFIFLLLASRGGGHHRGGWGGGGGFGGGGGGGFGGGGASGSW